MYASWDKVEYASTRLMSSWISAMNAAPSIVIAPMMPTTWSTQASALMKIVYSRPTRYTPAATMVAAWISAETGVGPAMASGSHTWSGNCADLPIVPPKSRIAAPATSALDNSWLFTSSLIAVMLDVVNPVAKINAKMPNMNGTSPIRVVMNALIAASEFCFSSYQCPISRYEHTPMTSHPISSWIRFGAMTTLSMAAVNSDRTT